MNIKEKVGSRIKTIREDKGLSQKDLSFIADLDRSYIASVESGARNISIVNIEKIARALKVSIKQFFNNETFS